MDNSQKIKILTTGIQEFNDLVYRLRWSYNLDYAEIDQLYTIAKERAYFDVKK